MKFQEYSLNDLTIFNKVFRKDVTYDNIKSHKKLHPLYKRHIFGKPQGGIGQLTPPAVYRLTYMKMTYILNFF